MELKLKELTSNNFPSAFFVITPERDLDNFVNRINVPNIKVKIIRGDRCNTKGELFKEFSRVLQFPNYFGENWDAFEECIGDLSWLKTKGIIIIITNSNMILKEENEDVLRTFTSILLETATYLKGKLLFKIIFHVEEKQELPLLLKNIAEERILEKKNPVNR